MVSIIIPVYNVEQYLTKCLDSCFEQSFTDIEVIAVNDGSSDSSGQILEEYASRESRLKVLHQINSGVAVARSTGICHAQGEWLMFLDSDDYLPSDSVKKLLTKAENTGSDICSGVICSRADNGKTYLFSNEFVIKTKADIAVALLTEKIQASLCGKIFKSYLFKNVIVDKRLKIGEDAFVVMQAYYYASYVSITNDVVYYYYQRSNSVTHQPSLPTLMSRLIFIELTIEYYNKHAYCTTLQFKNAIDYFLMKELFSFLRLGGSYTRIPLRLRRILTDDCLTNKIALSSTPLWRKTMLRCYVFNPVAGRVFRILFVQLRSLVK